jgi:hypothetical protein
MPVLHAIGSFHKYRKLVNTLMLIYKLLQTVPETVKKS